MIVPASPNNMRQRGLADQVDVKELKVDLGALPRKQPMLAESSIPDAGPDGRFWHWLDRDQPSDDLIDGNQPGLAGSSIPDAGPDGRFWH